MTIAVHEHHTNKQTIYMMKRTGEDGMTNKPNKLNYNYIDMVTHALTNL